jgi:hypothetical protein
MDAGATTGVGAASGIGAGVGMVDATGVEGEDVEGDAEAVAAAARSAGFK